MSDVLDAVVIGAGWAGLGVSYGLQRSGLSHIVLERGRIGETWRSQRWESFRFNIPRVLTVMPGERYEGTDPGGAMTRDEFVSMLEDYASRHGLPVRTSEPVTEVTQDGSGIFRVQALGQTLLTRNIVAASGSLNRPKRPPIAQHMPAWINQIDASDYRTAARVNPGAVLVVGSGQSGGQIAMDLVDAGRTVFLATSRIGRIPRRHRGRDVALWLVQFDMLETRREEIVQQFGTIPARPLQGAVETLSLQQLSAKGVVLLGRVGSVAGDVVSIAGDVADNIRFADESSASLRQRIDDQIARHGVVAPPATEDPADIVPPVIPSPPIESLDLKASDVRTILWCTGFDGDFAWLNVPGACSEDHQPQHVNGIGNVAGLYFPGLDFAATRKSGTILAIADESEAIVRHILDRRGRR